MPTRGKVLTTEVRDSVKDVLLELKSADVIEISAQDLEKELVKNGIVFSRSSIGRIMHQLGIAVQRKKQDIRFYILKDWKITCTHHWLIATPNGPFSTGKCKKCGEEKDFSNALMENGHWTTARDRSKRVKFSLQS